MRGFWGVMEMCYILIVMIETQLDAFVRLAEYTLKRAHFTECRLYFNKPNFKKKPDSLSPSGPCGVAPHEMWEADTPALPVFSADARATQEMHC